MSRTYRHRHLPIVDSCALKFVDASVHIANRLIDERVESYYAHVLNNAPCLYGDPNNIKLGFRNSHSSCSYRAGLPSLCWDREKKIRSELGLHYPVARTGNHPWVSWFAGSNPSRTFERTRGHRSCRRKTKTLLLRFIGPENPSWRVCREAYFDEEGLDVVRMDCPGDISARWYVMEEAFPHARYEIDPWSWD